MNLLIPFLDNDLIGWAVFLGGMIPYQIHRFRTPFYVEIRQDRKTNEVDIYISRRFWFTWPAEAYKVLDRLERDDTDKLYRSVRSGQDDSAEKVIERTLEAKNLVIDWRNGSDLGRLEKIAKRTLKA